MKTNYFIALLLFLMSFSLLSQAPDIVLDQRQHHLIDRMDIQNPQGFTGFKPYNRSDVYKIIANDTTKIAGLDKANRDYLLKDGHHYHDLTDSTEAKSKKPVLKHFYTYPADLFSYSSDKFKLSVNPLIDFKIGTDNNESRENSLFLNTRGIEVEGSIDNKIGFYSSISDNQARFPFYVNDRIYEFSAVPGQNFWKPFNGDGLDFFDAKGYFNFKPTESIRIKFGYDKNFIGNGYRSLILSDYGASYTHLRIDTKIWKLHYTNLYADLNADLVTDASGAVRDSDEPLPRKLFVLHRLDWKIRKNLSLALFESIIYGGDSTGAGAFDPNFFNPIIFYRAIEGNVGSGVGNAILGLDAKWNFLNHFSLYGQLLIDEFLLSEFLARDGWWANKFSGQIGLKYINIGNVEGLDAQLEYNSARPFTYSHTTKRGSYSHYNLPLAHPLGANFNELLGVLRYQPNYKLSLTGKIFFVRQGLDNEDGNFGSNILLPNSTRIRFNAEDTGHSQLQGTLVTTTLVDLGVSYMLFHNLFAELNVVFRNSLVEGEESQRLTFISSGLRLNLPSRVHEF